MKWTVLTVEPEEMLEPYAVVTKSFPLGTVAGSLGQKKNPGRKPGLNEDAALVAYNHRFTLALLIDGHYQRDTTELMIDLLHSELDKNKTRWHFSGLDTDKVDINYKTYSMTISQRFFDLCKTFVKRVVVKIREHAYEGEASFTIMLFDQKKFELHYYQVGDLLFFMSSPDRHWGPAFQIGTRQFYEWINMTGIGGFHHGSINCHEGSKLILATDGLQDQPTFSMEEIEEIFTIEPFTARRYVEFALESNSKTDDDNITVFCLQVPEIPE